MHVLPLFINITLFMLPLIIIALFAILALWFFVQMTGVRAIASLAPNWVTNTVPLRGKTFSSLLRSIFG